MVVEDGAELHPDWVEILNRRAAEIDSGVEAGIPMEQAFADARAALRPLLISDEKAKP